MAKYDDIINGIFFDRYEAGAASVRFERKDLAAKAHQLKIAVPKNLGPALQPAAQDHAADAAKTIDADFDAHINTASSP